MTVFEKLIQEMTVKDMVRLLDSYDGEKYPFDGRGSYCDPQKAQCESKSYTDCETCIEKWLMQTVD